MTRQEATSRPATAHDVAREAGVSQSAVSLVFSGKSAGRVSQQTRELIESVASRLDYSPNAQARSLRTGTTGLIGLVVPDASHPYFGQLLVAAEHTARATGRGLTMIDSRADADWSRRVRDLLASGQLEGCILYLGTPDQVATLEAFTPRVVLVEASAPGFTSLDVDIDLALADTVDHLVTQGHQRIAHLTANYPSATFARRRAGLTAALDRHGLSLDPALEDVATFDVEDATAAARRVLSVGRDLDSVGGDDGSLPATAVVCDDDLLAGGAYRACHALGLKIPEDVAIVGFGDLDVARYVLPELTSVALPTSEIGAEAVSTLVAMLDAGEAARPKTRRLPLIVRGSTQH